MNLRGPISTSPRSREEGTVLLLILGLVTLVAVLVAVVTDVSALYLERRQLVAAADGAALAGAQKVNESRVYTEGLPDAGPVPLNADAAEDAALAYVNHAGIDVDEVSVQATATTVSVNMSVEYRLPIASKITIGSTGTATVSASATARTAVVP
ncbi:MAG: pilus assembly protein TadG-related protein [Actinomycetes bacterium]